MKIVSGITLTLLLLSMLTLAFNLQPTKSEPSTIIVPDDYEKIQWAIGNASNGDIISVRAGTYNENVFVNKTVSLIGENKNTTIIDGAGTTIIDSFLFDGGIFVFADDVKIANFTVRNGSYGIYIRGDHISGNRVTVTDCVAYNNWFGLEMFQSSQNLLRRNLLFNNSYNLHIGEFWHINEFLHDIDTSNLVNGKPVYYLANKKNLSINPVSFPNIGYLGVVNSTNVRISDFSISRNGEGLLIAFSSDTLIERIEATNNFNGISLSESLRTTIRHCNFSYNYEGIFAYYSDYVIIEENTVSHNDQGIFLMGSNYGTVYHNNFVENGLSPGLYQARAYQSYNCHLDDGYPSGGNYWSDYAGVDLHNGPYQNETGSDGIGDTPYIIDGNNQDNYPLMNPWTTSVEPTTWTVDDDAPADFSLIQEAINEASPGDTIFVHSGTYYENVIVNKTVSLVGENRSTTVIDAKGKGTVVVVTAEAVNIQDFTVQNSGIRLGDSGIVLSKSMSNIVEGNIISNNGFGIGIALSNNNTIYQNVLVNNWVGMRFYSSRLNIVSGNVITNNHDGIKLFNSGDNVLRNNSMVENVYNFGVSGDELPHFINDVDASNTVDGKAIYYLINKQHLVVEPSAFPDAGYLAVINSTRITVQDFCFFNNFQGVLFAYTNNSKIENVNISDNFHGIMLFGSNNTLKGNNLTKNGYAIHSYGHSSRYFENVIADNNDGIWLIGSNNSIRRNAITNNNYRGIYLVGSNNTVFQNEIMNNSVGIVIDFYDNKIYHNNFINNVKQSDLNEPRAIGIWDGGYPSGGNYWSDYSGIDLYSGPYQNETGSDGIGDTLYFIDENNQDNYPLMEPWSPKPPSPVEATQELIETIETWNLSKGIENSLTSKLDNVIHLLDKRNEKAAINKLTALVNQVDALRGKKLTNEEANYLISEAQRIIDFIKG